MMTMILRLHTVCAVATCVLMDLCMPQRCTQYSSLHAAALRILRFQINASANSTRFPMIQGNARVQSPDQHRVCRIRMSRTLWTPLRAVPPWHWPAPPQLPSGGRLKKDATHVTVRKTSCTSDAQALKLLYSEQGTLHGFPTVQNKAASLLSPGLRGRRRRSHPPWMAVLGWAPIR